MRTLTREQERIVAHKSGHARVLAVAGSGKTETMIARVLRLVEVGIPAADIQVLLYNRSATDDFAARLRLEATWPVPPDMVLTHHALALRILRRHEPLAERSELVAEEAVANRLCVEALRNAAGAAFDDVPELSEQLKLLLTLSKANVSSLADTVDERARDPHQEPFAQGVLEAAEYFEEKRIEQRLRFFDDLSPAALTVLQRHPAAARGSKERQFIIVDEYQDINEVQQQVLKRIAADATLMVVGDPDQCIYEWRGAKPEYLLKRFEEDFGRSELYTLSQTFRYGHALSLAANCLITRNTSRHSALMCSSEQSTARTTVEAIVDREWMGNVALVLRQWHDTGRRWSECAVLARRWSALGALQLQLVASGLAFRIRDEGRFILRTQPVHAARALLRVAIQEEDPLLPDERRQVLESLLSIAGLKAHIGVINCDPRGDLWTESFLESLNEHVAPNKRFLVERLEEAIRAVADAGPDVLPERLLSTESVARLFRNYISQGRTSEAQDIRKDLWEGFRSFLAGARWNIRKAVSEMDRLERAFDQMIREGSADVITLTTAFRAKGMQWPLVAVIGLDMGILPDSRVPLEAERRVCYVAATRARERLYLVGDASRPSLFLNEMAIPDCCAVADAIYSNTPQVVVDEEDAKGVAEKYLGHLGLAESISIRLRVPDVGGTSQLRQLVTPPEAPARAIPRGPTVERALAAGQQVEHPHFGAGQIVEIIGRAETIVVDFGTEGRRKLQLRAALRAGMTVSDQEPRFVDPGDSRIS